MPIALCTSALCRGRMARGQHGIRRSFIFDSGGCLGATLLVKYGFYQRLLGDFDDRNDYFLAGVPISFYAAKYGVDMDLLTRGAGLATSARP